LQKRKLAKKESNVLLIVFGNKIIGNADAILIMTND